MATPAQHLTDSFCPTFCRLFAAALPEIFIIASEPTKPPWTSITPWNEQVFRSEFENPCSRFYGLRINGELVGFLVLHLVSDEAHILNFCILERYRGFGLGKDLLRYVLEELKELNVDRVTLEVKISNLLAQSLYGAFGFSIVGLRERYYTDTLEDALVMAVEFKAL